MKDDCYGYDGLGGSVQCNDSSFGFEWRPYDQLLFHVPSQYNATLTRYISNDLTFADSDYLGRFSRASFYLIFIGTILAGITMVVALIANRWAFLFGAFTAWLSFLVLVVGAIIWTVSRRVPDFYPVTAEGLIGDIVLGHHRPCEGFDQRDHGHRHKHSSGYLRRLRKCTGEWVYDTPRAVVGSDLGCSFPQWITWGAAGAMLLSIVPLMFACCTGRGGY